MGTLSRTIEQKTNYEGFPKPGELIEMTGAHDLEASDRALLNVLYRHAHDSGRLVDPLAEWEMPLATLREAFSRHGSTDRLHDSIKRLMSVMVKIVYVEDDGRGGEERRDITTHLFDFFDVSAAEFAKRATLRYGLPRKLVPALEASRKWGRIRAEMACSLTSKYAIALYELIQLREHLDRCVETFKIDRLRDLLGVPPGAYERGDNFYRKVIEPAVLEVNGLSEMGVQVELIRRHSRAPVHQVNVAWWKKSPDEFRAAIEERNRSKVGRMARLKAGGRK